MIESVERRQRVDRLTVRQDTSSQASRITAELDAVAAELLDPSARRAQRFGFAEALTGSTRPHRWLVPADRAPRVGVSGNQAKRLRTLSCHDQGRPGALSGLNERSRLDRVVGALAAHRLPSK